MQLLSGVLLILVVAAPAEAGETNPVSKVIQLLGDLQAKILKEGEEAQKIYEEFSEYCEDRSRDLGFSIKTLEAEKAELEATIEKATADISVFETKIDELAEAIATADANLKNATLIRDKETADFLAEEKELVDIIDMLERAIGILEKEMAKGASMLQMRRAGSIADALQTLVKAAVLSTADASRLTALVQQNAQSSASQVEAEPEDAETEQEDEDAEAMGAPDPAVYKGHSGSIIETLESLLEKAETELADARKAETQAQHEYELLKQSLEDEMKFGTADMDKAKKGLAEATETKAVAEGDLAVTTKALEEDIKALKDLHHECQTGAQEFESATKSRGEELEALAQAKKVIKEKTGGAEELTYSLAQVSFLQVQLSSRTDLKIFEAVRLIKDLAKKDGSAALSQLASRMNAAFRMGTRGGDDPFVKVRGLITEMIAKLEKEAAAEATEKAFCDKEMAETTAQKEDKTAEVEKLTTKIDVAKARSAKLKEEVATLQKELAELAKMQAEMDALRQKEKELFDASKPEMEAGIEGVKMALKILREYYAKEDKAHAAAEGAGGSIIGILEVVEADFTKGLAEMIANEEAAAKAYEEQTHENEIERTMKEQDVKYKTKEAADLDKTVSELEGDLASVQTELDAVLEYLEKLKDRCIAKPETYEERQRRRQAEIAGLKEALKILEGETALLQVKRHLHVGK